MWKTFVLHAFLQFQEDNFLCQIAKSPPCAFKYSSMFKNNKKPLKMLALHIALNKIDLLLAPIRS